MVFDLADSSVTEALARALARALPAAVRARAAQPGAPHAGVGHEGAVMYLQGDLGAGKTTCVRSLLRALGVAGLVRSPTYTLVESYELPDLTCVHVDLYRLQALSEVDELGLLDSIGPGSLLMVEWPERGGAALPPADLDLLLRYAGDARQARLTAMTPLGAQWLGNLDTTLA
jgi:tRNA threonylcarbamoyladenosine biosynthesis protein TsaE